MRFFISVAAQQPRRPGDGEYRRACHTGGVRPSRDCVSRSRCSSCIDSYSRHQWFTGRTQPSSPSHWHGLRPGLGFGWQLANLNLRLRLPGPQAGGLGRGGTKAPFSESICARHFHKCRLVIRVMTRTRIVDRGCPIGQHTVTQ
jgi:hypothetical protein